MARIGKHKHKYEKYKSSGHKQENALKRKAKHEKRLERFAKRKEEGKCYEYSKEKAEKKFAKHVKHKGKKYIEKHLRELRYDVFGSNKNSNKQTDIAHKTSCFRKLDNMLKQKAEEAKKVKSKANS